MLTPEQFRQLIPVINGLIALVICLFCLVGALAFLQPTGSSASVPVAQTTNPTATPTPAPVVAALTPGQEHGKSLFAGNCAVCHTLTTADLIGPGLKGVTARTPGADWLKKWIRNSSEMVASGDAYAVQVFNKYQKIPMASFTSLSDQDLTDLVDYLGTVK